MPHTLEHPLLGTLISKSAPGVEQYLGLKYASLESRFAEAQLHHPNSTSGVIDATDFGPSVVTSPVGCDFEFSLIQKSLPSPTFKSSELEGLNLNITVPSGGLEGRKLPVFVFLHGGGLAIGGNSWPQYDFVKFVQLSIEERRPVIGISINYRTGIFGFLTSEELRVAGIPGNNGLRDQRVAFEWIKKNIAGFGGDPGNITVCGESAGGASATLHLYSQEPVFDRVISMGGTALLLKPLPPQVHEGLYASLLESLGLASMTTDKRIEALFTLPTEELMSKLPMTHLWTPLIDGDIIPYHTNFKLISDPRIPNLPGKEWLKSFCVGNNQFDASIMVGAVEHHPNPAASFITSIKKSLSTRSDIISTILEVYGISETLPKEDATMAVLRFINDIAFYAPAVAYARGWGFKSYLYGFCEKNPWDGRFKGHSSHVLDVAFLFQNFNNFLGPAQVQSAKRFARDMIRFANGDAPWAPYSENATSKIFGPSDEVTGPVTTQETKRGSILHFVDDSELDAVSTALSLFLAGQ